MRSRRPPRRRSAATRPQCSARPAPTSSSPAPTSSRTGSRRISARAASALALCARGGKVLASRRLRDDDRFGDGLGAAAEAAGRSSLLAVPLQQPGGEGAGLVLVFFQGERAFDDAQLELAAHVAAAARGALERSDLYERERRSRHLAQRLARAGRDLAGELDPDDVLDQSVRYAVQLLGGDGASARMLEGDEVVVRAAAGPGEVDALDSRGSVDGLARRRHRPDARDAVDRRRRRSIRGWGRPTRCSPPATRATSGCR